ncbi:hypothetical protein MMC25_000407 [Agyrium rufum]|nr:hypothetical protein [Agyrium rufum]
MLSQSLIVLILSIYTTLSSAWSLAGLNFHNADLIARRPNSDNNSTDSGNEPTATFSNQPQISSNSESDSSASSSTDKSSKSGTGKETITSAAKTVSGEQTSSGSATAAHTTPKSINDQLPAGGVQLMIPATTATTTYYKAGDYVTFAWNYTSLIVTPSYIDVLVSCQLNGATYTLAANTTVAPTNAVTWNTSVQETDPANPLPSEAEYTLIIYDAQEAATAVPQAGYLATFNQFTFGMYKGQKDLYKPLNEFVCATCSGALSGMERQTLSFLFGMGVLTVISFTWFANGAGVF